MERKEGFVVVMAIVKFRRGCKKLQPFEMPHWAALHLAVQGLEETAERLLNVTNGGTYEGNSHAMGVRSNCSRNAAYDGMQRGQGILRL